MAEQFVLKGVKELRDYSYGGSSPIFRVKNDPRGGSTWQIPKWYDKKGNNTEYISCTILDLVGTNYLLVIPTSMDTQLMVTYDDDVNNIGFSNFNAVDRIAVTGKDTKKIVVEYLLPSISGGAVAKRYLQSSGQAYLAASLHNRCIHHHWSRHSRDGSEQAIQIQRHS